MLSRRDQVQSYQFLVQRVISALVMRETDPVTPPFRRFVVAGFASLVAACVAIAVVGIYGLLRPGGKDSWRAGDRVILERETGAEYIYRDGQLDRVANFASGVLLLGHSDTAITVNRSSIMGVPRGPELGIAGAPDGLPPGDRLVGTPWTLCSRIVTDSTGTKLAATVLVIGGAAGGGARIGDRAILAENIETGDLYLVLDGHRHEITDTQAAMVGLGLSEQPRVQVGTAWLDAIPAGSDVAPLAVAGRGDSSAVPGARIGQLMVAKTAGGRTQYYVVQADGLEAVTETEFDLLFASKATAAAYPNGVPNTPKEISLSEAAQYALPGRPHAGPEQLPPAPPEMSGLASPDANICGSFWNVGSGPLITVGGQLPTSDSDLVTARRNHLGTVIADRVLIAPGRGALVDSVTGQDGQGVIQLITEQGIRYPLASADVVGTLGYELSSMVRLPAELVARVPQGVALDPAAAGTVLLQN